MKVQLLLDGQAVEKEVEGRSVLYLTSFYRAEAQTALKMAELAAEEDPEPEPLDSILEEEEKKHGIKLAVPQRMAIQEAMRHGVLINTGGQGNGKPTIINNVETLANIPVIINKGADWFASMLSLIHILFILGQ